MDRTPVRDAPAIVGRRLELSAIDAFVDGVASGVRTLVLAGEPGIGKTTLWRHGVDGCVRAGVRVLRARPASDETTLSSGGLADLFGDGILEADGARRRAAPPASSRSPSASWPRTWPTADATRRSPRRCS